MTRRYPVETKVEQMFLAEMLNGAACALLIGKAGEKIQEISLMCRYCRELAEVSLA